MALIQRNILHQVCYKFYVFKNQDFELENGNYVAKLENGENEPYLYEGNVTINNQLKTKLTFTLKPYFAKVKFKIKAFSAKLIELLKQQEEHHIQNRLHLKVQLMDILYIMPILSLQL